MGETCGQVVVTRVEEEIVDLGDLDLEGHEVFIQIPRTGRRERPGSRLAA